MGGFAKRKSVSPAELFELLDRAFARERPPGCRRCKVPLPFRVYDADDAPNWRIGTPTGCPHQCDARITAIVERLRARYELAEPHTSHADDEGRRLH